MNYYKLRIQNEARRLFWFSNIDATKVFCNVFPNMDDWAPNI